MPRIQISLKVVDKIYSSVACIFTIKEEMMSFADSEGKIGRSWGLEKVVKIWINGKRS